MGAISDFVTSPLFRLLFGAGALLLILGVVMHFGFRSAVALGYGVYDMMVIVFLFALSVCAKGISADPNGLVNQLFAQFYPKWIQPIGDMLDVHNRVGIGILQFLYEAGKLMILAMVIEGLERLFDLLRGLRKGIWVWWLSEASISVLGVFLLSIIWEKLEQGFAQQLQYIVAGFFVVCVVAVVILGLLAVFGPLFNLLGSQLFGFILTSLVIVLLTVVFALVISATGLISTVDAFVQNAMHAASTQSLMMACGTLLLLWLIWYVMYRLLRDRIL